MIHLSYFLPRGLRTTPTTNGVHHNYTAELPVATPSMSPTQARLIQAELVGNIIDSFSTGKETKK